MCMCLCAQLFSHGYEHRDSSYLQVVKVPPIEVPTLFKAEWIVLCIPDQTYTCGDMAKQACLEQDWIKGCALSDNRGASSFCGVMRKVCGHQAYGEAGAADCLSLTLRPYLRHLRRVCFAPSSQSYLCALLQVQPAPRTEGSLQTLQQERKHRGCSTSPLLPKPRSIIAAVHPEECAAGHSRSAAAYREAACRGQEEQQEAQPPPSGLAVRPCTQAAATWARWRTCRSLVERG